MSEHMTAKELEKRLAAKAIYGNVFRSHAGNFDIEIPDGTTLMQVRAIGEILGTDDVTIHGLSWDGGSSVRLTAVPMVPKEESYLYCEFLVTGQSYCIGTRHVGSLSTTNTRGDPVLAMCNTCYKVWNR